MSNEHTGPLSWGPRREEPWRGEGKIYVRATNAARTIVQEAGWTMIDLVGRFVFGAWGDAVSPEERAMNDRAAETGDFLIGKYRFDDDVVRIVVGRDREQFYVSLADEIALHIEDRGGDD